MKRAPTPTPVTTARHEASKTSPSAPERHLRLLPSVAPVHPSETRDTAGFLHHVSFDDVPKLLEELVDLGREGDVPATAVVHIEVARLRRHLRELPARQRLVLCLRYGIDCVPQPKTSVAQLLGVSTKTVYRLEQQALNALRAHEPSLAEAA